MSVFYQLIFDGYQNIFVFTNALTVDNTFCRKIWKFGHFIKLQYYKKS